MLKWVGALFLGLMGPIFSLPCMAWDGYDWNKGTFVEIEKGNLVRTGREIEIYDWGDGTYKDVEVLGIHDNGSTVEVEVQDGDETRVLDMDK